MTVGPSKDAQVHGDTRVVGERAHPVIVERARQRTAIIRTPADVERAVYERVVHRNGTIAVTSGTLRDQVGQCRANADRYVLDQVMLEVTTGMHPKVEAGVPRQRHEHVVEESGAGIDVRAAGAACQLDADLGFGSFASDDGHKTSKAALFVIPQTPPPPPT